MTDNMAHQAPVVEMRIRDIISLIKPFSGDDKNYLGFIADCKEAIARAGSNKTLVDCVTNHIISCCYKVGCEIPSSLFSRQVNEVLHNMGHKIRFNEQGKLGHRSSRSNSNNFLSNKNFPNNDFRTVEGASIVIGFIGDTCVKILINTGSDINLIAKKFVDKGHVKYRRSVMMQVFGDKMIYSNDSVKLDFNFKDVFMLGTFQMLDNTVVQEYDAIFGCDFIKKHKLIIDLDKKRVYNDIVSIDLISPEDIEKTIDKLQLQTRQQGK